MNQTIQTSSHPLDADVQLPQRSFRLLALVLVLWLIGGASYLYRQELAMKLGLWDAFEINAVNFSRFVDARDAEQVFQDQLILTRQGYRRGVLFVGPSNLYSRELLPLDSQGSYRMSLDVTTITDGTDDKGSAVFAGVVFFDKDKNIIYQPQSHMFGVAWNNPVLRAAGRVNFSGIFSPTASGLNRIPPEARYMKVSIEVNYGDPRASAILSSVKFAPYSDAVPGEGK